jgi:hypothetical protein
MKRLLSLASIVLAVPVLASAQTAAADGVQAMLRGDYDGAIRILRPLADANEPDPTASFFIGLAYESGIGVPAFNFRSCRYYLNSVQPGNPFMTPAAALADSLQRMLPPAAVEFCRTPVPFPDPPPNRAATPVAKVGAESLRAANAMLRGDYLQAFEILKPVAEAREATDHAAQFLLAALYDGGRGAPLDPTRACALYVRQMMGPPNELFHQQAMTLARHFFMSRGQQAFDECQALANAGFDQGLEPVTFVLGPGHSITLDMSGATILYQGREKHVLRGWFGMATPGATFLPPRHTALETRRPAAERRDFVELFLWHPSRDGTWTLTWHVFEVVRDDLRAVGGGDLAQVAAPNPPANQPELRARGVLRVNENGDAELDARGPTPRKEAIPSEAERREIEQENRQKHAVEAKVDWTVERDMARSPMLTYSDGDGCGNVTVYGQSADRTEAIVVWADKTALGLTTAPRVLELANARSDLAVVVHVFARAMRSMPFCSDVRDPSLQSEEWRAVAGTVTVEISPPGIRASYPSWMYRATVTITGAEFVDRSGARVRQRGPITLKAFVGSAIGGYIRRP